MSTNQVFEQFNQLIIQYLTSIEQGNSKVGSILLPEQLQQFLDFSLSSTGDKSNFTKILEQILDLSPATQNKFFCNQLYAGADHIGILGDWLATILNTSMATYEVSPVFSLMEKEIFNIFSKQIGRIKGEYQGLMLAGGSLSNQYAIHCARSQHSQQNNQQGSFPLYDIYVSDQSHYSFSKSMMVLGLGSNNCIKIETNEKGEMLVEKLNEKIQQSIEHSRIPLLVVSTAGTTVLGAFDPIKHIDQICKKYKVWHHVDAAWGGAAALSNVHQYLLEGIQTVDSVVINAHKMLRAPQQTSLFFVHHPSLLKESNSLNADYLFHEDNYAVYNNGDDYTQCARKVDSLKLRLMMKYHGIEKMGYDVDKAIQNAEIMYHKLKNNINFIVYPIQSYSNVCFRLKPYSKINNLTTITDIQDYAAEISSFTKKIKQLMLQRGNMMINYQPIKGYPDGFRMVFINPNLDENDIDIIINEFEILQSELHGKEYQGLFLDKKRTDQHEPIADTTR